MLERVICLIIGYFIGCIQTAFIVGKFMGKIDIRDYGSGNAGTTNVTRVMGAKAGAIVFLSDILKAVLAYVLCTVCFAGDGFFEGWGLLFSKESFLGIYAGVGVVLGHDFPFYLKFKGGKGIASTLGLILCINWQVALITYAIGFVIFIAKKYISLASLSMVLIAPIVMKIFDFNYEAVGLMFGICVLAYWQHSDNIKRLIKGEENKFSIKKAENK